ncbi:hypothetical protein [Pseudomonas tohonis]|uniref:hypothetical protein n=1 Tax=Pseudomonas tohonis TaxID=2725477 RepID=UPI0021DAFC44|nr:hypothetical protein [Pseudomonas tohonis]UXY55656.1 hypothetical protein N9L84_14115 [Pseudomonas tohonis]
MNTSETTSPEQQPQTEGSAEAAAPAKAVKKQNVPWYQTLKTHDRGQRPGAAPRGSRRSMGKR